jgi:FemAB-related protein (PEP-CTERM system-associated)
MSAVAISAFQSGEENEWDGFVADAPLSTFFHTIGWKDVIEKAFGHRTFYLVARRFGHVCGVMPLTQIKSVVFGNSLISNAFCVHGGPIFEDPATRDALMHTATKIGRELKARGVESRSQSGVETGWNSSGELYVTFRRPIAIRVDENMKMIPRKQRAMVRKAIANGLTAQIDPDASRLHHVYAISVRHLGTPVFPRRYFQLLKERFGKACDIVTVLSDDRPIASVMNFYFRDEVLPYYGGGTHEARALAANDFMYWEVMRRACENGFRIFDFGRSKIGTGAYDFKNNWGFSPTPLTYEQHSFGHRKMGQLNPLNPKFQLAIRLWQHLPLPLTKAFGPPIVRCLG